MARTEKLSDYDIVMEHVYQQLVALYPGAATLPFDKNLIDTTARLLATQEVIRPIKNIPDIKYTYDARRNFPSSMLADGFWGIRGVGKGRYELKKLQHNNLIRIPADLGHVAIASKAQVDQTHPMVARVLGSDEQATLRRIEANGFISDFLGFPAHRLQGHERTSLSCGQIEVDEVYVGSDGKNDFVIPISGKGGDKDFLSYTQALNLSLYSMEKPMFKNYTGRPLGVWQQPGGAIFIVEFSCAERIEDIRIIRAKAYSLLA